MGRLVNASLPAIDGTDLIAQFTAVRAASERYCAPLAIEDYGLQAMPDTSPAKWHLAHTSWFFETFLLKPFVRDYRVYHRQFEYLFNSYYNGIGAQYPRAQRALLSRPTVDEVYAYRAHVDAAMLALLDTLPDSRPAAETSTVIERTVLGLHHEQQHQELVFTDLKYNLAQNPLLPVYQLADRQSLSDAGALPAAQAARSATPLDWHYFTGGLIDIGAHNAPAMRYGDFVFDNETPRHQQYLPPYALASRPLCNAEVLAFIDAGGYRNPALWLADGWATVQQQNWQHPLYWQHGADGWQQFTLHGLQPLDPAATAAHLSAYEADALARWYGARLPSETEWEHAARQQQVSGHLLDSRDTSPLLQPGIALREDKKLSQLFGSVWEWTSSSYAPYPGFQPATGAIGEYNGKFMCNQLVLRGGACTTAQDHIRASYRNFFYPPDRWQFSGVRLARSGEAQ